MKAKPFSIKWDFYDQCAVNESGWKKLLRNDRPDKLNTGYGVFFKNILQRNPNITCKLKTLGDVNGVFVVRFHCTMKYCKRQYKFVQVEDNKFKIMDNSVPIDHREDPKVVINEEDYEILNEFDFNKKLSKLVDLPTNSSNEKSENTENLNFKVDEAVIRNALEQKVEADKKYKLDSKAMSF